MPVELRSLVDGINEHCRTALETAAGLTLSRNHVEITPEHYLSTLLRDSHGDVVCTLNHYGIGIAYLQNEFTSVIDLLESSDERTPRFSWPLLSVLKEAYLIASLNDKLLKARGIHVFIAYLESLRNNRGDGSLLESLPSIRELNPDELQRGWRVFLKDSKEDSAPCIAAYSAMAKKTNDSPIFVSYRRDDSRGMAERISDTLQSHLGNNAVFLDVDKIAAGLDWREEIDRLLKNCKVLLAIIGPKWISGKDASGQSRLDDPADLVRIEIETALSRGIPVVPVLVENAKMPHIEQLPVELQGLAFRQGMQVRGNPDFRSDISRLQESLMPFLGLDSVLSRPTDK